MPLPNPKTVQQIAALKKDPQLYEAMRQTLDAHNELVTALGPGDALQQGNFVLSAGLGATAAISGIIGTFKRGRFTLTCQGAGLALNPTLTLNFPLGLWKSNPAALVVRNGGTGTLGHSWTESTSQLVITLAGTPIAATYIFQVAVRE